MSSEMIRPRHSAIYEGFVSHHRLHPRRHDFRYRVFMMYIDLDEAGTLFDGVRFWSWGRGNLVCFLRRDYLGDASVPLDTAVRDCVEHETGIRPAGPVRMLTNLRFMGYVANPITCYYCFDAGDKLQFVVAEVTNTPWGDRHRYVIPASGGDSVRASFNKAHHVSPFMPMAMTYDWRTAVPAESLTIDIHVATGGHRVFSAQLALRRRAVTAQNLRSVLVRYPLMTWKVTLGIYWQAFRLWLKKTPFYANPKSRAGKKVKGAKT